MQEVDVAILGATGVVGEELLRILYERNFPVANIYPLASNNSKNETVLFGNKSLPVKPAKDFDFSKAQLGLFSVASELAAQYVPQATESGMVVIDKSACYRLQPGVPLLVPEVNIAAIEDFRNHNIIANPNCATIQLAVALKPIYDAVGINYINVCTYQSASGAGRKAVSSLADEIVGLLNGTPIEDSVFTPQLAFNVLPMIDSVEANGYSKEEMKLHWETQKIFADPNLKVNATCVRVPVFYGHSMAVHLETSRYISSQEVKALLKEAPGVILLDEPEANIYPTPVPTLQQGDAVFVGRVREDHSRSNGINLWIVADNIRKGAALNAVQIAELLVNDYM